MLEADGRTLRQSVWDRHARDIESLVAGLCPDDPVSARRAMDEARERWFREPARSEPCRQELYITVRQAYRAVTLMTHSKELRKFTRSLAGRERWEDVFSETCRRWMKRTEARFDRDCRGAFTRLKYLAREVFRDAMRGEAKREKGRVYGIDEATAPTAATPSDAESEDRVCVERALADLTELQHQLLWMRFGECADYETAARRAGISVEEAQALTGGALEQLATTCGGNDDDL